MTNGPPKKKDNKTSKKDMKPYLQKPLTPEPVSASDKLAPTKPENSHKNLQSSQSGHCGNIEAGPPPCAQLYGPTGYNNISGPHSKHKDKPHQTPVNDFGPEKITAPPPPDNGIQRSDLVTKQNAIYIFKPFATIQFPGSSGPPQPYLNDFKGFQR